MEALSAMYGAAATWRRRWYAGHPSRTRHLSQPVISIGNLRVGGTGKTPTVACIARLLLDRGERPAILSRGYGREKTSGGVTVVSDGSRVLAGVENAGDEPLLLARSLPGVPVVVCADRYAAGLHAESSFRSTVHLLDDGFQHVKLARDIDLLLVDDRDLDDRVLPAGRLREPIANASIAHAVVVPDGSADGGRTIAGRVGVREIFRSSRVLGAPVAFDGSPAPVASSAVFAVAGVARPEGFFDDLRAAGLTIAGSMTFRDHHRFEAADIVRIVNAARASGAATVVTTEKDQMRLERLDLSAMNFAAVPLRTRIQPEEAFAAWIAGRLAHARAGRGRTS